MSTQKNKFLASQISTLINEVYDGVDRSKIGPIFIRDKDGNFVRDEKYQCPIGHPLAVNTFISIVSQMCPKGSISGDMTFSEKE